MDGTTVSRVDLRVSAVVFVGWGPLTAPGNGGYSRDPDRRTMSQLPAGSCTSHKDRPNGPWKGGIEKILSPGVLVFG
jgi:hypothetical protein